MKAKIISVPDRFETVVYAIREGMPKYDEIREYLKRYKYADYDTCLTATFVRSLYVSWEYDGKIKELTTGMILTDGASVPKIPIIYGHFKELCEQAAYIHDKGFGLNTDDQISIGIYKIDGVISNDRISLEEINAVYRALLLYYGVSEIDSFFEHTALDAFGSIMYNDHTIGEKEPMAWPLGEI